MQAVIVAKNKLDDWLRAQIIALSKQRFIDKILVLQAKLPLNLVSDIEITYFQDRTKTDPLELLVAVLPQLAEDFILIAGNDCFFCDLSLLSDFAADKKAILVLQYAEELLPKPRVLIDENYKVCDYKILAAWRDEERDGYFASGISYLKREIVELFIKNAEKIRTKDLIDYLLRHQQLYGLPLAGCFKKDNFVGEIENFLKQPVRPALFVDKDGTLIKNSGYPFGPEIEVIPELVSVISHYQEEKFYLFIVTNQSGIARGKFTVTALDENLAAIHAYYLGAGIKFTEVAYCPYLSEAPLPEYRFSTLSRKPNPGMLLNLGGKYRIDWQRSVVIGDNPAADRIRLPYLKTLIIGEDLLL